MAPRPLRLVLDTNVWLDWLVFDDRRVAALRAAVEAGRAHVYNDAACEAELVRVLAYPRTRTTLDPQAQAACVRACRAVVTSAHAAVAADDRTLPRCADPDDQKFLELAQRCGADLLVTRDKQLLQLPGRRSLPFAILAPEPVTQVLLGAADGSWMRTAST